MGMFDGLPDTPFQNQNGDRPDSAIRSPQDLMGDSFPPAPTPAADSRSVLPTQVVPEPQDPSYTSDDDDAWSAYQRWISEVNAKPPVPGVGIDACPTIVTPQGRKVRFPFKTPRPGQLEAVDDIATSLMGGQDVLLCANTGVGKSPMALSVADIMSSAWIIVGARDLVEQYKNDFEHWSHVGFLKSRQSFVCNQMDNGLTCSEASDYCRNKRKKNSEERKLAREKKAPPPPPLEPCPYALNRDYALSQGCTVMTTSMALTLITHMANHPAVAARRSLMIVDECSELEDQLLSFYQLDIDVQSIVKAINDDPRPFAEEGAPKAPTTIEEARGWIHRIRKIVSEAHARFSSMGTDNVEANKYASRCESIMKKCGAALAGLASNVPFHLEVEDNGIETMGTMAYGSYRVRLLPLEARGLFDFGLGRMAYRTMFCSATTGPADLFANTLGLKQEPRYIEMTNTFAVENRPVIYKPAGNLCRKTIDSDLPKVAEEAFQIATQESDDLRLNHIAQKGIIHTHTNRVMEAIRDVFKAHGMLDRIVMLKGGGQQRMDSFNYFCKTSEPKILLSPSAAFGISLTDELGRWQIIAKMPFAYLGDASVKHRQTSIRDWYPWQTTKNIIQTCGRIVRSQQDWGTTYIIDEGWSNHYRFNQRQFPAYVREAIQNYSKPLPSLPPAMGT